MTIKTEQSLSNFEFWSGAKINAEQLTNKEFDTLENELEDLYPDGMTDTELNNLFWFEFEWICEILGLSYNDDTGEIER